MGRHLTKRSGSLVCYEGRFIVYHYSGYYLGADKAVFFLSGLRVHGRFYQSAYMGRRVSVGNAPRLQNPLYISPLSVVAYASVCAKMLERKARIFDSQKYSIFYRSVFFHSVLFSHRISPASAVCGDGRHTCIQHDSGAGEETCRRHYSFTVCSLYGVYVLLAVCHSRDNIACNFIWSDHVTTTHELRKP